jgi:endoglucanase
MASSTLVRVRGSTAAPTPTKGSFALLAKAAREDAIPYQVHVTPGTTPTDAKAMQVNRGGMATALLSVPLRYMHTPSEVISLGDLEATARLMAAYCRRVRPDTDFRPGSAGGS